MVSFGSNLFSANEKSKLNLISRNKTKTLLWQICNFQYRPLGFDAFFTTSRITTCKGVTSIKKFGIKKGKANFAEYNEIFVQ